MRGDQTVYRLRTGTTEDAFGNTVPTGTASRLRYDGVQMEPVEGDESVLGRQTTVSRWRLRAHSPIDLRSTDQIEHRGVVYEIDGEVQVWGTPPRGYTTALLMRSA